MNSVLIWKLTLKKPVLNISPPVRIPKTSLPNNVVPKKPLNKFLYRKPMNTKPPDEQSTEKKVTPKKQFIAPVKPCVQLNYYSSGLIQFTNSLILDTDTFLYPININVTSQFSTYMLDIFISSNGYSITNPGEIYLTFAACQDNNMTIDNSYNLGYYINQLSETKNNNSFITMANNSSTMNYHLVNSKTNTNDYITTSRIIFTPEIIGNQYISPVITMTNNLPTSIYYNFSVTQLK